MTSKNTIRKTLRANRQSLSQHDKSTYSQQICERLISLPAFENATHIACYQATKNEVNLEPLIQHAWQHNKNIYLPVITEPMKMVFYSYTQNTPLKTSNHNTKEPDINTSTAINPLQLELIITPLIGFDAMCNRLGQGAGFYDHYFKHYSKEKATRFVGVAFEIQKINKVPIDDWDVALDYVVTEQGIYTQQSK